MKKGITIGVVIALAIGMAVALGWLGGMDRQEDCAGDACPTPIPSRSVSLSFYNPEKDKDVAGNVMCSAQGLVHVKRNIPLTNTPIQDTIRLLLSSRPSATERAQGLVSEFPLEDVKLTAASLSSGILTLTFEDPDHRTGGGSCFVSILRAQVEGTAKQFSEVREVRLMPEDFFQP